MSFGGDLVVDDLATDAAAGAGRLVVVELELLRFFLLGL